MWVEKLVQKYNSEPSYIKINLAWHILFLKMLLNVTIYKICHIFYFLLPFKFYYMILKSSLWTGHQTLWSFTPIKSNTCSKTHDWTNYHFVGEGVLSDSLGLECLTRHTATMLIGFGTNHPEQSGRRCFRSSVAVPSLLLRPQPLANSRSGKTHSSHLGQLHFSFCPSRIPLTRRSLLSCQFTVWTSTAGYVISSLFNTAKSHVMCCWEHQGPHPAHCYQANSGQGIHLCSQLICILCLPNINTDNNIWSPAHNPEIPVSSALKVSTRHCMMAPPCQSGRSSSKLHLIWEPSCIMTFLLVLFNSFSWGLITTPYGNQRGEYEFSTPSDPMALFYCFLLYT